MSMTKRKDVSKKTFAISGHERLSFFEVYLWKIYNMVSFPVDKQAELEYNVPLKC